MKTYLSKLREVNAVYRTVNELNNIKITSSRDVADFARKFYPVDIEIREAMVVLFLNNANRTVGYCVNSIGGLTGTLADVRLILRDALLTQATALILIHNHPSGTLQASESDKQLTRKVKDAAAIMDIKLLDHLILTEDSFYSFADDGKI